MLKWHDWIDRLTTCRDVAVVVVVAVVVAVVVMIWNQ